MTGDTAFGTSPTYSLGLEEEVLLVDGDSHALAPVAEQVLAVLDLPEDQAGHEAYRAEIELRSPVSRHVEEATAALRGHRVAARTAAERAAGARLMAVGIHPDADLFDAPHVDLERYRRAAAAMRGLLGRTPEGALHVHVGMPDADTAIRSLNGLREDLPLLAGLSAGSPYWFGTDSGMASARSAVIRAYPGRGVPPAFSGWDHYTEIVGAVVAAGGLDDYTNFWWDVRPHPKLGTVEVREMDVLSRLDDAAALAALVHALAVEHAESPPFQAAPSEAIAFSSFRAARDGLDATILQGGELRSLREAARATVERIRPRARELGADAALDGIERILRDGGGAERQRAAHASGGMPALLELLVEETAGN
jgi:glutamate---cysteine ligase / carboxylate-amine ligase